MNRRILQTGLWAGCLCAVVGVAAVHGEPTTQKLPGAGEFLMSQAVTPRRNGKHDELLRALRHMKDPTLGPLFEALSHRSQPSLQIHGILGLAEQSQSRGIDLAQIAEINSPPAQAQLISAAMDSDLISLDQAEQLLSWSDLEPSVRLLVATRLVEAGRLKDSQLLVDSLKAKKLGRKGLAALLLTQLGDPRGTETLKQLNASDLSIRDAVRSVLLRTALRHKLHLVGAWAHSIATEPGVDSDLKMLAMRTAMRFGHAPAMIYWKQIFQSYRDNVGRQRRLGMIVLALSPWVSPSMFEGMVQHDDAMLKAMGEAGRAIASDAGDTDERLAALIDLHHPLTDRWALSYAQLHASPARALFIFMRFIASNEQGTHSEALPGSLPGSLPGGASLSHVATATTLLMDIDPAAGQSLLRPILANEKTDDRLASAILLGLVRSQKPQASEVSTGLTFGSRRVASLALLLHVRGGKALSKKQLHDLRLIVRGGSTLEDSLRIQATWQYLKYTKQTTAVLDRVLK